jgi:hypothetical protein
MAIVLGWDQIMNATLKSIGWTILLGTAPLAGVTYAQAPATAIRHAPAQNRTPVVAKAPGEWIVYDDATYTPLVDDVSRHLASARQAFDAKDSKKAALALRTVAEELKQQAARAQERERSLADADKALLTADIQSAQDSVKRLNASAMKVSAAARAVESGKIKSRADLDKAIDKAARADMDRRWLVADETTWYPLSEQPQSHFTDAAAAYAKKDYRVAAADIRKATGYLRLEAGRATSDARHGLDRAVAQLDQLASSVNTGAVKGEQSMAGVFAQVDHNLALAHRSKAAEYWARHEYDKAGYELKAAASGLEDAAGWTTAEAKAGVSATVADTRTLGDKLASGATWTRVEVAKGFEALGNSINALGKEIGSTNKAAPFHAGA